MKLSAWGLGMIVSHEHKFIFLKTKKTAGTSIELALSALCDERDVITPLAEIDEGLRAGGRGARRAGRPPPVGGGRGGRGRGRPRRAERAAAAVVGPPPPLLRAPLPEI